MVTHTIFLYKYSNSPDIQIWAFLITKGGLKLKEIIKRNGERVPFNKDKIIIAIEKAENSDIGIFEPGLALKIANEIEKEVELVTTVAEVERKVFEKLCKYGNLASAKAYESYRSVQEFKRHANTSDEKVLGVIRQTNKEALNENSNKDGRIVATQRDLMAGEVSKDIARRLLIPTDILLAHDTGALHIHDMDYIAQPMTNCCLVNLKDMLANGTVMNGKKIDSPKSFQVACTVMTQIIAAVASSQYGFPKERYCRTKTV